MTYLKVLQHLKKFKVDRIILDTFTTAWTETGTSTVTVGTDHATSHTNTLKIDGITAGDVIYKTLADPLNLSDRETIQLHLYSTKDIADDNISLILSDGVALEPAVATINLDAVTKNIMNIINLTIPTPGNLTNIRSVGLKVNTTIANTTIYLGLCNATATNPIITVEELNEKIVEGQNYVLNKLGSDYTALPSDAIILEAVYFAAAAYAWAKQKENEQYQFDYGYRETTRNYGIFLKNEAKMRIEQYLMGGSVSESDDGESVEPINTDIIGGSDVWGGRIT